MVVNQNNKLAFFAPLLGISIASRVVDEHHVRHDVLTDSRIKKMLAPSPIAATKPSVAGVASLAVGAFAFVTAEFLPVGVLPEVAEAFNVTSGQAGLMMTLPSLLAALSAPGLMIATGKADRRLVLILLSCLLVIGCTHYFAICGIIYHHADRTSVGRRGIRRFLGDGACCGKSFG